MGDITILQHDNGSYSMVDGHDLTDVDMKTVRWPKFMTIDEETHNRLRDIMENRKLLLTANLRPMFASSSR
jgi:hypothetical protein